jgi:hypothetical protein
MKIALCFAGQTRSFRKGYEYYKRNLLDRYPGQVDVFIHTWESKDALEAVQLYPACSYEIDMTLQPPEQYNSVYTNTPDPVKYPPYFTISSYYSIFKSCQRKIEWEVYNGEEYDWVIKTRFDYALNLPIPFERLDNSKLYIPSCRMVPTRDFGNDQFAFSGSQNMNKYMQTFLHIPKYYKEGTQIIGEDLMSANIKHFGLTGDKLVYVDMKNPFPPGAHNGTPHSLIRDDYEQWTKSDGS